MTNENPTTNQPAAEANYLVAYAVRSFGKGPNTKEAWTRVGAAFPHKKGGPGLTLQLDCLPLDGRIVLLPPQEKADEVTEASQADA